MRLLPIGASRNGSDSGMPATVVREVALRRLDRAARPERDGFEGAQFSRMVISPSAPPSM